MLHDALLVLSFEKVLCITVLVLALQSSSTMLFVMVRIMVLVLACCHGKYHGTRTGLNVPSRGVIQSAIV